MKVRVTKAEMSSYWYSKHIGENFEVEPRYVTPTMMLDYRVLSGGIGSGHFISLDDCEVVLPKGSVSTE